MRVHTHAHTVHIADPSYIQFGFLNFHTSFILCESIVSLSAGRISLCKLIIPGWMVEKSPRECVELSVYLTTHALF